MNPFVGNPALPRRHSITCEDKSLRSIPAIAEGVAAASLTPL
jgi:hypothetical protein